MPEYDLLISITGRDKTGGIFNQVEGALRRIGETALGMLTARIFEALGMAALNFAEKAISAAAQVEMMTVNIESLVAREMALMGKAGDTAAQYIGAAIPVAGKLMEKLGLLAVFSPYLLATVQNTYRMNVAFGFTTAQAMEMTTGLLNMGAGLGANNEQLDRMAYNLAQVRLQGKVTKLDIRQLALAGLDLNAVLVYIGRQMKINIKDNLDFNDAIASGKIQWTDFVKYFAEYSDTYFAGASERMAKTLYGISSTLKDIFMLTMPKILGPGLEVITTAVSGMLDAFGWLYQSPILDNIGENIRKKVQGWLGPIATFAQALGEGLGVTDNIFIAFRNAVGVAFGMDAFALVDRLYTPVIEGWWNLRENLSPIGDFVSGITESIKKPFETFGSVFYETFTKTLDLGGSIREAITVAFGPGVMGIIDTAISFFTSLYNTIAMIISGNPAEIFGFATESYVVQGILTFRDSVLGFFDDLKLAFGNVKTFFEENGPAIMQILGDVFNSIVGTAMGAEGGGPPAEGQTILGWLGDKIVLLSQTLLDNAPTIMENLRAFADTVKTDVLPKVKEFFDNLVETWIPKIEEFGKSIGDNIGPIILAITGLGLAFLASKGGDAFLAGLPGLLGAVTPLVLAITGALTGTGGGGAELFATISKALTGIPIPLLAALGGFFVSVITFLPGAIVSIVGFLGNMGSIFEILKGVGAFLIPIWDAIVATLVPALESLWASLGPLFEQLQSTFQLMLPGILTVVAFVVAAIVVFIGIVTSIITGIVRMITTVIQGVTIFWEGIQQFVLGISEYIAGAWMVIVGIFTGNGEKIRVGFETLWQGVKDMFSGVWNAIVGIVMVSLGGIIQFIAGFVEGVIRFFQNLWDRLVGHSIVTDMLTDIYNTFVTWFNTILDWLTGIISKFLDVGKNIGQSIVDGILATISGVVGVVEGIINSVEELLGIDSPSKWATGIGKNIGLGLTQGLGATIDAGRISTSIQDRTLSGISGTDNSRVYNVNITNSGSSAITEEQIVRAINRAEALSG